MNINPLTTCCFSGYREEKFPFPLSPDCEDFLRLQQSLSLAVADAVQRGFSAFLCGMCYGFDLLAASAVLSLPSPQPRPVSLVAALPFLDQPSQPGWSPDWVRRYERALAGCGDILNISGRTRHAPGLYAMRNRFLVENSSRLIGFWDGRPGGTRQTFRLARQRGLTILNLARQAPCV